MFAPLTLGSQSPPRNENLSLCLTVSALECYVQLLECLSDLISEGVILLALRF